MKVTFRALGVGIITGAADDDPSAIGTYASAGAKFGLSFLWIAPALLPMMYAVTYLSAKLGRVYGKGLFAVIRDQFPRWILVPLLTAAVAGNIIEAAADLGGIGAALNLFIPIPIPLLVAAAAAIIFALQYFGSYALLRNIFRWLALALLAYLGAALLAKPNPLEVLRATFVPRVELTADFVSMVVACIGTSLSAYVYTWQSNQEVEEDIARGRTKHWQRMGATNNELRLMRRDVVIGMSFSNLILYFIILATGVTLHQSGHTNVESATQAAQALTPLAGEAAGLLFTLGIVGVGFLAVPVMTTGAAYDLVQGFGKPGTLHAKPRESKLFYAAIGAVAGLAVALNFLGVNPMRALVWSGIVQGFSVPPLLLMIMLLTNNRTVMGEHTNGLVIRILGWGTVAVSFLTTVTLVALWVR